jgi:Holliday junction DNA helicase RuvA
LKKILGAGMIAYVKGTVAFVYEGAVVVDVHGVGYLVNAAAGTLARLPAKGGEVQLFTYMQVTENGQALHGFLSQEELRLFTLLISVSGIGPKVASAILGALTPQQVILSIVAEDAVALSKAPGVGKKTAQRVVLELKDKIKSTGEESPFMTTAAVSQMGAGGAKQDATDALLALGYGRAEAVQAVLEAAEDDMAADSIIKLALKKLARSGAF